MLDFKLHTISGWYPPQFNYLQSEEVSSVYFFVVLPGSASGLQLPQKKHSA
jgi:hypothetical protein